MCTNTHRRDPKVYRIPSVTQNTTNKHERKSEQRTPPKFVPGVEKNLPS